MSNILNKLKELVNYYQVNRQVGHTTRMLMGATNCRYNTDNNDTKPAIILTHNQQFASDLNNKIGYYSGLKHPTVTAVPFTGNYDRVLKGHHSPLLIDNCLLQMLFNEAATEIEELSVDANRYKQDNITLNHFNKKLQDDLAISLSIKDKLDIQIESLNSRKQQLVNKIDNLVKAKSDLLTYRENESNSKSFLSPLDMLIENKEVKSIDIKIEYHD